MRVVVSGSRTGFSKPVLLYDQLDRLYVEHRDGWQKPLTVVEGCADGVDHLAELWALRDRAVEYNGREGLAPGTDRLALEHWPAQWNLHSGCWCSPGQTRCRFAGPRRNLEMRDSGIDRVVVVSDDLHNSRGTRNMATIAHESGIPVTSIGTTLTEETLDYWVEELQARRMR